MKSIRPHCQITHKKVHWMTSTHHTVFLSVSLPLIYCINILEGVNMLTHINTFWGAFIALAVVYQVLLILGQIIFISLISPLLCSMVKHGAEEGSKTLTAEFNKWKLKNKVHINWVTECSGLHFALVAFTVQCSSLQVLGRGLHARTRQLLPKTVKRETQIKTHTKGAWLSHVLKANAYLLL